MERTHTDDELIAMTQQYSLDRDGKFIVHLAYEEINKQVRCGRDWMKCHNCGNAYPLDREGASTAACSEKCFTDYIEYLNNPE
jgi:hypothetical protein